MTAYALTILLGAFLLFQVQPLIGKYILPWFGGGPGVWTTCMLFFQILLVGGYAYAHFLTTRLKPRQQVITHGVLLLVVLIFLPIIPADRWKPTGEEEPTMRILLLLMATVGMPYLVVSTTGPLLQKWFSIIFPLTSPYRLYALSNIGSLLALVSYPFFVEPHLTRKAQAISWSVGMVLFVIACGYCAWMLLKSNRITEANPTAAPVDDSPPPSLKRRALWLALPACASALLLAATNKICLDVAVIPFLWVLPLSLYLVTFIICFDNPRWYSRMWYAMALPLGIGSVVWVMYLENNATIVWQIVAFASSLFLCCMVCHGELYALKPSPKYLTTFYLMISIGGALGGLFVAVVAPRIFPDYHEFHYALVLCWLLVVVLNARHGTGYHMLYATMLGALAAFEIGVARNESGEGRLWIIMLVYLAAIAAIYLPNRKGDDLAFPKIGTEFTPQIAALVPPTVVIIAARSQLGDAFKEQGGVMKFFIENYQGHRLLLWLIPLAISVWFLGRNKGLLRFGMRSMLAFATFTLIFALVKEVNSGTTKVVDKMRNFYGVLTVMEYYKDDPAAHHYMLQHGRITHGLQFTEDLAKRWPTSYYGEKSGIGLAMKHFPRQQNRRIGVVGLGTGTLAVYGKEGDYVRVYDINPDVIYLATNRFTHLKDCPATNEVILGDARLSMEHEPPQNFDILALDAFSSDAIPVHLLTKEAVELYLRHLKPDGVLVVHISNRHLNLEPVLLSLSKEFNLKYAMVEDSEDDDNWWMYSTTWVMLSRNEELINNPEIGAVAEEMAKDHPPLRLWTDDYTALFQLLD